MSATHDDLKAFMLGGESDKMRRAAEKDAALKLLLDLLPDGKFNFSQADPPQTDIQPRSFEQAETMIGRLLAGSISDEGRQLFLHTLYNSPDFFYRVQHKLQQQIAGREEAANVKLTGIDIKSDEYLLAEIIPPQQEAVEAPKAKGKIFKFPRFFRELSAGKWAPAAAAASIILFIAGYALTGYYNTEYRIDQAETLLLENYRIYMSGTPRLSGGYQTTGISTLMSEGMPYPDFLDEAAELTDAAIDWDAKNIEALHMNAKLHIIRKDYRSAENLFKQIGELADVEVELLNDMGVMYLNIHNTKKAERYLRLALQKDPTYSEVYYNLALLLSQSKQTDAAKELLEKFFQLETDEGWYNAGQQLFQTLDVKK